MSLESSLSDAATYLADGIKPKAGLSTALTWDNFDINLGTPSRSHTIYYIYQAIEPQDIINCVTQVQMQQPPATPEHSEESSKKST